MLTFGGICLVCSKETSDDTDSDTASDSWDGAIYPVSRRCIDRAELGPSCLVLM